MAKEEPTADEVRRIAQVIMGLVVKFKEHPFKINSGRCENFASQAEDLLIVQGIKITIEEDYDRAHVWFSYKGRHFDAEEPYGQLDKNNLPIFARLRYRANQLKLGELFPSA